MKPVLIITTAIMLAGAASAESVAELNQTELNNIDKNNDGFLSKDEFNAFSDYAFQAMDDDKNGTLGQSEAKPFLDIKQFQTIDRNGDNVVSRGEYDAQMDSDFTSADQDGNGRLD
ncbi:signal peptide protein [Ruegeria sp. ANG-R]|uniref:hypothetical protein n=1 Tax=Ruegeria sp. ANG-R TaxID=1577903 RepID=UPI00057D4CAF|nr:hypothetical protein [Ruegeria sp. ANG-R]KIC38676.1 signal peptide protein [Ruegeria sp. ANG-R]